MRPIDADTLIETVEDHVASVSCCPTADWSRGKTQMKDQILEDIRNAPTVRDWISVKDSRPELYETVLFIGKTSYGTWFSAKRGWWDGSFWRRDPGETVYSTTPVTHWMPLPKPPEEDE